MAALAQVALHHHSPYDNLGVASEPRVVLSRQVAPAPPPLEAEASRAPSAARRAEMLIRQRIEGSSQQPAPPMERRTTCKLAPRTCDEQPMQTTQGNERQAHNRDIASSSSQASPSSPSHANSSSSLVCVPANPVQRLRGVCASSHEQLALVCKVFLCPYV